MSKKQLLTLSFLTAIPATGLLVKMLFSLGHILADKSNAGAVVWIIYVVCLLGSAFFATLPLWLGLYYPAAGFEAVPAGAASLAHPAAGSGKNAPVVGDNVGEADDEADYEEMDGEEAGVDKGEAYFEEDAMEDDLDDFDGGFDDDDDEK